MLKDIANELVEYFIEEIKQDKYKDKIKIYLLDPSITYIINKCYPYVLIGCVLFILLFLISIAMFALIIKNTYHSKI